jgi:hypothetical protein
VHSTSTHVCPLTWGNNLSDNVSLELVYVGWDFGDIVVTMLKSFWIIICHRSSSILASFLSFGCLYFVVCITLLQCFCLFVSCCLYYTLAMFLFVCILLFVLHPCNVCFVFFWSIIFYCELL